MAWKHWFHETFLQLLNSDAEYMVVISRCHSVNWSGVCDFVEKKWNCYVSVQKLIARTKLQYLNV